jgi:hypothetical protein
MNSQKPTKDRQYNGKMKKNKQWFRSSNITKNRGYLRTMNTLLTTVIRQMPQVDIFKFSLHLIIYAALTGKLARFFDF